MVTMKHDELVNDGFEGNDLVTVAVSGAMVAMMMICDDNDRVRPDDAARGGGCRFVVRGRAMGGWMGGGWRCRIACAMAG